MNKPFSATFKAVKKRHSQCTRGLRIDKNIHALQKAQSLVSMNSWENVSEKRPENRRKNVIWQGWDVLSSVSAAESDDQIFPLTQKSVSSEKKSVKIATLARPTPD